MDSLVIHDREAATYRLSSATYNVIERSDPKRCELTFRCEADEPADSATHPKLEVTIITDSAPDIGAGSSRQNQPGYIERKNLWNVTGYYEWTHEAFEDFTVIVRERGSDDSLVCEISGHITLNRDKLPRTPVVVLGRFRHDPQTKRSAW